MGGSRLFPKPSMRLWCKKIAQVLAPFFIVLAIWETAALSVLALRGVAFPTPWQTWIRLLALLGGEAFLAHSLYRHIGNSLRCWLEGFSIASLLGVGYGLLAGTVPALARATAGIPRMLLLMPGLAWVPVAILLFGIGEAATVFMIAITAFAPVAINVQDGINTIDPRLLRAAGMMGATRRVLLTSVILPAALPSVVSGLRIGLGMAWRVLVAAEMVIGTGAGLGYAIVQARWTLDYPSSFACLVVICAIGLSCEHLFLGTLERRTLQRWRPAGTP